MIRSYMKWRRRQKWAREMSTVNPHALVRDYLLDTQLSEWQQLSTLLGLPETTDDDVASSKKRLEGVINQMPLVLFFSNHLATSVMAYHDTVSPWDAPLNDEDRQRVEVWLSRLLTANTVAIISQFVDMKLLEVKN